MNKFNRQIKKVSQNLVARAALSKIFQFQSWYIPNSKFISIIMANAIEDLNRELMMELYEAKLNLK